MSSVLSFSIFKGGTGKTTSAVNTAAGLAKLNKKVLLVDLDQQASTTKYLGVDPEPINPSLYHVFQTQVPASVIRQKTDFGFDLIPSTPLMAAIEEAMDPGDETMLREILQPLKDEYDYILVDSPPGKAQLAFNAIVAADWLIVPASAERMAIDGVTDLIRHVQEIFWHKYREQLQNQEIRILFTMFKQTTSHSPGVVSATKKIYRDNVLDMLIPESVEFPRSFDLSQPIINLAPTHQGAIAYEDFSKWIIKNVK